METRVMLSHVTYISALQFLTELERTYEWSVVIER